MKCKLSEYQYQDYLVSNTLPSFQLLVNQPLNSLLIDHDLKIISATNFAVSFFGLQSEVNLLGLCFTDYESDDFLSNLFQQSYERYGKDLLVPYLKKLVYLQRLVFEKAMVIQFIDMLPYGDKYISKMTTYVPVLHHTGEVVAIQASTIETYILRFQGHIDNPNISTYNKVFYEQFSAREREVLFLICNGASQEHIAKILKIARGTVSSIIHHQLCPKFAIAGSNMKELMKKAISAGMSRSLPEGLWHPVVIVLNRELLEDVNLNELGR